MRTINTTELTIDSDPSGKDLKLKQQVIGVGRMSLNKGLKPSEESKLRDEPFDGAAGPSTGARAAAQN